MKKDSWDRFYERTEKNEVFASMYSVFDSWELSIKNFFRKLMKKK